jgi:vacuolar protein sorting-associated protein 54
VNGYAELLVKESTTLHKVLSKYLAKATANGIMLQVVEAIRQRIGSEFNQYDLRSDAAKRRRVPWLCLSALEIFELSG